jgi:ribonucleoside-diphosphate reductase alpha chain
VEVEAQRRFGDCTNGTVGTVWVEDLQDLVERVLIEEGYVEVAKAYILYRQKKCEIREAKRCLGVSDGMKLSLNAVEVLKRRYLKRDLSGKVIETPGEMFARSAYQVSLAEKRFGSDPYVQGKRFLNAMKDLLFLPNSPTLMNAGLPLGQLSACFVLPIEDSIEDIFDAVKHMALIHQSGGGTGFSFSRLRPKNDAVGATGGVASGPVSFMRVFDVATDVVKQGGRRRGANMGVLSVNHPDILEFIGAKDRPGFMENFNLSVAATNEFMRRAKSGADLDLINPRNSGITGSLKARDLMRLIATSAWRRGEPGVLFIDRINTASTVPGTIEATNPCGEQPLLPYESCDLGSINLSRLVKTREVDWDRLEELACMGVRFLDDVLEVNKFPLPEIREATLRNRKIGLGVMGFAEMLIEMGLSYASPDAPGLAEEIMGFLTRAAREESERLGNERGSFPTFDESTLKDYGAMRNATVTTVAPTGSISIIAGTSSGIEPLFAVSFVRHVLEGTRLVEVSPLFMRMAKERGIYSKELEAEVVRKGSLQDVAGIPQDLKDLFVTALEVSPEQHVRVQAAFQIHTDNGVSKTVNLPARASIEDVLKVYDLAYNLGCKGVTVYRYGCRDQVLYFGDSDAVDSGAGKCQVCGR